MYLFSLEFIYILFSILLSIYFYSFLFAFFAFILTSFVAIIINKPIFPLALKIMNETLIGSEILTDALANLLVIILLLLASIWNLVLSFINNLHLINSLGLIDINSLQKTSFSLIDGIINYPFSFFSQLLGYY